MLREIIRMFARRLALCCLALITMQVSRHPASVLFSSRRTARIKVDRFIGKHRVCLAFSESLQSYSRLNWIKECTVYEMPLITRVRDMRPRWGPLRDISNRSGETWDGNKFSERWSINDELKQRYRHRVIFIVRFMVFCIQVSARNVFKIRVSWKVSRANPFRTNRAARSTEKPRVFFFFFFAHT